MKLTLAVRVFNNWNGYCTVLVLATVLQRDNYQSSTGGWFLRNGVGIVVDWDWLFPFSTAVFRLKCPYRQLLLPPHWAALSASRHLNRQYQSYRPDDCVFNTILRPLGIGRVILSKSWESNSTKYLLWTCRLDENEVFDEHQAVNELFHLPHLLHQSLFKSLAIDHDSRIAHSQWASSSRGMDVRQAAKWRPNSLALSLLPPPPSRRRPLLFPSLIMVASSVVAWSTGGREGGGGHSRACTHRWTKTEHRGANNKLDAGKTISTGVF